jgi:hypothetical protein
MPSIGGPRQRRPFLGGPRQRRLTVVILGLDVGLSLEQLLEDGLVPSRGGL